MAGLTLNNPFPWNAPLLGGSLGSKRPELNHAVLQHRLQTKDLHSIAQPSCCADRGALLGRRCRGTARTTQPMRAIRPCPVRTAQLSSVPGIALPSAPHSSAACRTGNPYRARTSLSPSGPPACAAIQQLPLVRLRHREGRVRDVDHSLLDGDHRDRLPTTQLVGGGKRHLN
jgi:hypothetical protein